MLTGVGAWVVARLKISSARGASAVEYAILVGVIAAVVIVAVFFLGNETSKSFSCTGSELVTKGASNC